MTYKRFLFIYLTTIFPKAPFLIYFLNCDASIATTYCGDGLKFSSMPVAGVNSDFLSRGWKILISLFSSRAGRTLHRPWNSTMR